MSPNNTTIQAKYEGYLPLTSSFTQQATSKSVPPTSIVEQLCDNNFTITFIKTDMKISKKIKIKLEGLEVQMDVFYGI